MITVEGPPRRRPITMRSVRLLYPLRQVAASPLPPVAFFSSSVINTKSTNCVATDANNEGPVRRNRPKFKWHSASFVGTVEEPLRVHTRNGETLRAWTFLRAKVSPDSDSSFRSFLLYLLYIFGISNLSKFCMNITFFCLIQLLCSMPSVFMYFVLLKLTFERFEYSRTSFLLDAFQ